MGTTSMCTSIRCQRVQRITRVLLGTGMDEITGMMRPVSKIQTT